MRIFNLSQFKCLYERSDLRRSYNHLDCDDFCIYCVCRGIVNQCWLSIFIDRNILFGKEHNKR